MNSDTILTGIAMDDLSLHLYDIFNRRTMRQFDKCHGNRITDLGFRPGGLWLVSSSLDWTIKVWDLTSASLVDVLAFDDACRSFANSPNIKYMATVQCEQRGIYLWSSKTYYRPSIALRQLPADYEPATVFQLPGASFIDEKVSAEGGDDVAEQHPMQQEVTEEDGHNGGSSDLLDLCTFSGLSASRWANLSDLDLHRQRNKPKQQFLKAGKAQFFLISTPGLVPSFDVEGKQVAQSSRLLNSPIVMSASNHEASIFSDSLLIIENDAAYFSAFHHLLSSNVSSVYSELVNLRTECGAGSELLLKVFIQIASKAGSTARNELGRRRY
ncbi:WD repeat-containing protein 36 [Trichinella nelsoni]|uniref:WD repeat-containing protein 36 n=1 Tax=Trichinella nelsoni TaxID=6336 RepID=A0A0V0RKZ8_9BILA|nr:WD repeat-containing protein 36 [Trichinella nelsoni]